MDQFDFYKELYTTENDRRITVNDSLSIPIAIVTALVSILFYLLTTFDYGQTGWPKWAFLLLAIVSVVLVAISVYSLIRAFSNMTYGYEYKGLPYPQELLDWHMQLTAHYTKYTSNATRADEEYRDYLIRKFAEHANFNMKVNDQKTKHVFTAKRFMVLGLVGIATACVPFAFNYFHKVPDVHKVEIVTTNPITNTPAPHERRETTTGTAPGTTAPPAAPAGQTDSGRQGATTTAPTTATQTDTTP